MRFHDYVQLGIRLATWLLRRRHTTIDDYRRVFGA